MQAKVVVFIAGSRKALKSFPEWARREAGNELWELRKGRMPGDWKSLKDVGIGALEIRLHQPHEYRVICVAKFSEAVYVVHAFAKKTKKLQRET